MDSRKLTDKEIEALLKPLRPVEIEPESIVYSPSLPAKADYEARLKTAEKLQELGHKDQLMETVGYLAKESFKLLALLVVAQMLIRLFMPNYTGVSDDVIKIISISIFGQVIVIVGALATYLFKKGK